MHYDLPVYEKRKKWNTQEKKHLNLHSDENRISIDFNCRVDFESETLQYIFNKKKNTYI